MRCSADLLYLFFVSENQTYNPHMFDIVDVTFLDLAMLPARTSCLSGSSQRLLSYDFMGSLPYVAFVDLIRQDSRHRECGFRVKVANSCNLYIFLFWLKSCTCLS